MEGPVYWTVDDWCKGLKKLLDCLNLDKVHIFGASLGINHDIFYFSWTTKLYAKEVNETNDTKLLNETLCKRFFRWISRTEICWIYLSLFKSGFSYFVQYISRHVNFWLSWLSNDVCNCIIFQYSANVECTCLNNVVMCSYFRFWMLPSVILKKLIVENITAARIMDLEIAHAIEFMIERVRLVVSFH